MIEWLRRVARPRKILIHINNTNPILVEDSPERGILNREGIEVAHDGLEFDVDTVSDGSSALVKKFGESAHA